MALAKKKIIVKMRGVKPNFSWLRLKQKPLESTLDVAMVREDSTEFAKSSGARAYFRMILPPERPSWWRRLFKRITEKVDNMLINVQWERTHG